MNLPQQMLLVAVRIYRTLISPALGAFFGPTGGCRFTPTCSVYAASAIQNHGSLAGICLATKRICRCHPWGGCGHDPVPEPNTSHSQTERQPLAKTFTSVT